MLLVIKTNKIKRCCLEYLSLPLLGFAMLVNSRQVGTSSHNLLNQPQLPAHTLLQPFDDDEDVAMNAGTQQASLRSRPLLEVRRDVRARMARLSESNL